MLATMPTESRKQSPRDKQYLQICSSLRIARIAAGMSQEELAEKLGKPQSFVSKVELAERRIDLIETIEICSLLNIKLGELFPEDFFRDLL